MFKRLTCTYGKRLKADAEKGFDAEAERKLVETLRFTYELQVWCFTKTDTRLNWIRDENMVMSQALRAMAKKSQRVAVFIDRKDCATTLVIEVSFYPKGKGERIFFMRCVVPALGGIEITNWGP